MDEKTLLEGYTPISLNIMRLEKVPGFDLYILGPTGLALYRERNVRFTIQNMRSLMDNNIQFLYFKDDDEGNYFEYIEDNLDSIIDDEKIARERKASLVYDTSAHLAQRMLMEPDSMKIMKRASKVMDTIVSFTSHDRDAYRDIIQMLPTDYYTHTHSANVATYSLAIGQTIGLTLDTGLWELTLGALLHDIGKSRVPKELLYKKSPLTDGEFEVIRQHVNWGLEIVGKCAAVPQGCLPAIAQHHEKPTGRGYPMGISDLHLFGKIVGIADTFDAITTNRPYARARSSFEAILLFLSKSEEYDSGIVESLIRVMAYKDVKIKSAV